ncbi:unnamed protein product [Polarella glacialis]|uniref:Fe2OG dioxygenase domain-containing protein n=1 Tax=Polarella glacialis TaxID=89957 RepID=A0A813FAH1_POLGL|nr:unnamed protein product [Polarella glacialis]
MLSREEMFRFVQTVLGVVDYDHEPVVRHVLGDDASAEASIPVENAVRAGLGRFLIDIVEKEPWRLTRYSEQLWLTYDKSPVLQKLLVRVQRITGLPESVVNQSEDLQVLRYGPHGHYSCHHDMSPDTIDEGKDAPQIATVAIFLNDVTRGGEIAFPAANRDDIAPSELEKYWMLEEQCQPRKACTRLGGVVFSPKKGDALLWYNIRPEFWNDLKRKETQRQGFGEQSLMWSSVHCGAEVIEGEKWMANMWIGLGPHGHEEL